MLLGFVWLLLLRWCAGCMVWSTIFAALASAAVVTLIAYFKAGILTASHVTAAASALDEASGVRVNVTLPSDITTASANMQTQWAFFAYAMTAMSVILLFVVAWMRSSIKMAVGIIKEASGVLCRCLRAWGEYVKHQNDSAVRSCASVDAESVVVPCRDGTGARLFVRVLDACNRVHGIRWGRCCINLRILRRRCELERFFFCNFAECP